jgi:hypothetical protein
MKTSVLVLFLLLPSVFCGCRQSYQDTDVVGSWQYVGSRVTPDAVRWSSTNIDELLRSWDITTNRFLQTYTFSPDHTFTAQIASSKDLRHFGVWDLKSDQLTVFVRSNSFFRTVTSNRETAQIVKATDSVLVLKDRDPSDAPRERLFRRLK